MNEPEQDQSARTADLMDKRLAAESAIDAAVSIAGVVSGENSQAHLPHLLAQLFVGLEDSGKTPPEWKPEAVAALLPEYEAVKIRARARRKNTVQHLRETLCRPSQGPSSVRESALQNVGSLGSAAGHGLPIAALQSE